MRLRSNLCTESDCTEGTVDPTRRAEYKPRAPAKARARGPDRRRRRPHFGHTDPVIHLVADRGRDRILEDAGHLVAERFELRAGWRIVVQVALGLAYRARLRGEVEPGVGARAPDHELGAPAADVENERRAG